MMGRRLNQQHGTPVPKRDLEKRATVHGPVTVRQATPEELAKYRAMPMDQGPNGIPLKKPVVLQDTFSSAEQSRRAKMRYEKEGETVRPTKEGPSCGLTKQAFLESVAAGETIASVERAWSMKYNSLGYWVQQWGLKGITPELAREELAKMSGQTVTSGDAREQEQAVEPIRAATGVAEPSVKDATIAMLEEALRQEIANRQHDNDVAARIIASEAELHKHKDTEIERMQAELRQTRRLADDRERLLCAEEQQVGKLLRSLAEMETERDTLLRTIEKAVDAPDRRAKLDWLEAVEDAVAGLTGITSFDAGMALGMLWLWCENGDVRRLREARLHIDRLVSRMEAQHAIES